MIQPPIYQTLDKLLQGRLFEIPDYQRTYSWEKKQRDDLFFDIKRLATYKSDHDRHHFMATVVCLGVTNPQEQTITIGADEFPTLKIVDGQQRLTTLIILLKEISLALSAKIPSEKKAQSDLSGLLVKDDKRTILLQTNHDSSNIFRTYLRDAKEPPEAKDIKTQADLNLAHAIRECRDFIKGWKKDGLSVIELLRIVKNRLGFVLFILNDEAPVYTVFEVLNSRGLDVDSLDKCKSMLMGIAFERCGKAKNNHINELHENWKKIYQLMGKKFVPGQEILRFAATLSLESIPYETISEEDSLKLFRQICEREPNKVTSISGLLFDVAEKLEDLYKDRRREAVTRILHARLLAVAILLATHLKDEEKKDLLASWEKITFRIFGMYRQDARTKRGAFPKLAWRILNEKLSKKDIDSLFQEMSDEYPIDEAIKQMLKDKDCYYSWEEELRYFLFRYEEYLVKKDGGTIDATAWEIIWNNSPHSTIEHICPQGGGSEWTGKMGRGKGVLENNVNRLGNLILLPPGGNSEASTKGFPEKKKIYKKFPLRIMNEIISLNDWNKDTLNQREQGLIEWAKQEWR